MINFLSLAFCHKQIGKGTTVILTKIFELSKTSEHVDLVDNKVDYKRCKTSVYQLKKECKLYLVGQSRMGQGRFRVFKRFKMFGVLCLMYTRRAFVITSDLLCFFNASSNASCCVWDPSWNLVNPTPSLLRYSSNSSTHSSKHSQIGHLHLGAEMPKSAHVFSMIF